MAAPVTGQNAEKQVLLPKAGHYCFMQANAEGPGEESLTYKL